VPSRVEARHAAPVSRNPRAWFAALVAALAACVAVEATAATFYVDNQSATCSNLGPGTEAQPYCTISAAVAAQKGAGVEIVVKPGIYREQVTVPASGASGSPFILRASGPGVVVDGADDLANTALWVQTSGPVYRAAGVTWTPLQVFVDGVRLTASTAAPAQLPANSFIWVAGEGLYVNVGGANPGSRQTFVGRRSYGFNLFTKSWVTIDGFEILRSEERGINIQTGCSDLVIARNRVRLTRSYGIQCNGSVNVTIDANLTSECGLHGIGLTAGSTGCLVRNNESFRNADPAIRRANGIYLHGSTRNTLHGNRVHDNQDSGMQFSGGANDNVAWNNSSWNNGDHGYDHLDAAGTVHVNDLAFGNYKDGFSIEGVAPNTRLHNCIAVDNGLTTNEFNLWVNDPSTVGFVSDHNIFWNSTAQAPIKYITTQYATLAGYQAASGQDAHSRQADPRFVNGPAGDFRLTAGSPAIDAGTSAVPYWPALDQAGQARMDDPLTANTGAGTVSFTDIGVREFVPTTDLAPVVTAPGQVKPAPGSVVTFVVTASDPNGQPITSLTMVPVRMPTNSGAVFTPNANNSAGTFTWALGSHTGDFKVRFVATNTLSGSATTTIRVRTSRRLDGGLAAATEVEGGEDVTEADIAVGTLELSNAFPNPSRGAVEFALDAPRATDVSWAVFDLQGRMVWSEERTVAAGRTALRWDGMTSSRGQAATGVYLVRARVGATQFSRRIVRF
jgi:parallel beta-helix repeat protein